MKRDRGVKVRFRFAILGLIILLIPFVVGCEVGPEDKWPVVVGWTIESNLDVAAEQSEDFGIISLKLGSDTVKTTIQVRTYNVNQDFKFTFLLERLSSSTTEYAGGFPTDTIIADKTFSEFYTIEHQKGTFKSGKQPQGIVEFALSFKPQFNFESIGNWLNTVDDPELGTIFYVTDYYDFRYRVIVEDADGRTASFYFDVTSKLLVE